MGLSNKFLNTTLALGLSVAPLAGCKPKAPEQQQVRIYEVSPEVPLERLVGLKAVERKIYDNIQAKVIDACSGAHLVDPASLYTSPDGDAVRFVMGYETDNADAETCVNEQMAVLNEASRRVAEEKHMKPCVAEAGILEDNSGKAIEVECPVRLPTQPKQEENPVIKLTVDKDGYHLDPAVQEHLIGKVGRTIAPDLYNTVQKECEGVAFEKSFKADLKILPLAGKIDAVIDAQTTRPLTESEVICATQQIVNLNQQLKSRVEWVCRASLQVQDDKTVVVSEACIIPVVMEGNTATTPTMPKKAPAPKTYYL